MRSTKSIFIATKIWRLFPGKKEGGSEAMINQRCQPARSNLSCTGISHFRLKLFFFLTPETPTFSHFIFSSNALKERCSKRDFMISKQWNACFITIIVDFLDTSPTSFLSCPLENLQFFSRLIVKVIGIYKNYKLHIFNWEINFVSR